MWLGQLCGSSLYLGAQLSSYYHDIDGPLSKLALTELAFTIILAHIHLFHQTLSHAARAGEGDLSLSFLGVHNVTWKCGKRRNARKSGWHDLPFHKVLWTPPSWGIIAMHPK